MYFCRSILKQIANIEKRIGYIYMHHIIGQNRQKGKRADLQIIVNINLQYILL